MSELTIAEALRQYHPWNEQEEKDRQVMLGFLTAHADCFSRENLTAHFTASSWITDPKRSQVLMAYHKVYQAWAWTGGHADGDTDLLSVAIREAEEETGIHARPLTRDIFSIEILPVSGHEKKGAYVPSHLHLNVTYLLEADPAEAIRAKEDENAAVAWFALEDAVQKCGEPWMAARIYRKLNARLLAFSKTADR